MSTEPDPRLLDPAPGATRLVEKPGTSEALTARRATSMITAITRGLAEYLGALSITDETGRVHRFAQALHTWADPEDPGELPSVVVFTQEEGVYGDNDFQPRTEYLPGPGKIALRRSAELELPVVVEIWSQDLEQRDALVAMCEDAFEPVDWMSGFVLELPHYHGARASYLKLAPGFTDSVENASKRWRIATFRLSATLTQWRVVGHVPTMKAQVKVETE